ncbi:hypothetical protein [Embleya sp. NPDC005575]|uniref:hypothetical protein n=1 Tax=Embleya sp. NPDC005575 TaxID=3156892 RepID=UPI0033AB057D
MFTDADPFSDEDFERYERELPGALRAAGDTFPGPSSDLVARGLARGRQRRRFRTLRRSALAAVLVTASVAGWATAEGVFDSHSGPADRTGAPWVTDAPRDLVPLLAKAVPSDGQLTNSYSYFAAGSPRVLRSQAEVMATYTTASGSSELGVLISRPVPGSRDDSDAYCDETLSKSECSRSPEPDGAVLTTRRTIKDKGDSTDPLQLWRALYTRPDGARVDVRASGDYLVVGDIAGVSGLNMEQIAAIARSASWEPVGAAVATPEQQVTGLVPALLRSGARVASADGSSSTSEFVVDTDSETHRLNVSVDSGPIEVCPPAAPKADSTAGTCEMVKLSDGTSARIDRARTAQGRYAPWALTAFRAHGLRIRFEQDQSSESKRDKSTSFAGPSMLQDQVKAIAASPRWDAP